MGRRIVDLDFTGVGKFQRCQSPRPLAAGVARVSARVSGRGQGGARSGRGGARRGRLVARTEAVRLTEGRHRARSGRIALPWHRPAVHERGERHGVSLGLAAVTDPPEAVRGEGPRDQ